ncbi:MAG: hypothetical protein ABIY55_12105, partial [Kofleriaceae bacterium]
PDGLGFPFGCPTVNDFCSDVLFDSEGVFTCLVCTHLATAQQAIALERLGSALVFQGPTPMPTPSNSCPVAVEIVSNAGSNDVLDSGWTGLAHNSTVVSDGKLTFTVACSGTTRPCGVCNVSGPIQNLNADTGDINPRRCSNDTSKKCTDSTACTAPGTCEFFFGAPTPLSAGQIGTCVVNRIASAVTGTMNAETGAFATTLSLRSSVYTGTFEEPCPRCQGDGASNDGTAGGTCTGGTRSGQACDANGTSPVPSFGSTSLDCPPVPGSIVANQQLALDGSSGTEIETLSAGSPNCEANPSLKCFCANSGNNPQQPNACLDDTTTPGPACVPVSPGSNKGQCEGGPIDSICNIDSFRFGCSTATQATDCPASGDFCKPVQRPCYLDNGVVGGSVQARGMADPPDANGTSTPVFASLFCIPPTTSVAVNAVGGLPGLGRIELPLISKVILSLP